MAVTLTPLLHVSTFTKPLLRNASAQEWRDDLDLYSRNEVDDLVSGIGGLVISDFVRSILDLPDPDAVRDALDVYGKSETYSTAETYSTGQVYNKSEVDNAIATAVSNIVVTGAGTGSGGVVSVNAKTGVVVLAISDIGSLQAQLDAKATTTSVTSQIASVNANITSNVATLNASISALNTSTTSALALKANASSLASYTTAVSFNALSTTVATQTANINAASTRIATLEAAVGGLLPESRFVTGAVTLAATDAGKAIRTGAATITIAANATVAIPTNAWGMVYRGSGAGAVNFVAGTGTTIVSPLNLTGIADQSGSVMWWKQAANTVFLSGDLG